MIEIFVLNIPPIAAMVNAYQMMIVRSTTVAPYGATVALGPTIVTDRAKMNMFLIGRSTRFNCCQNSANI